MRFIRDTAITFSAHIIAVILGIAAVIVIASVLGSEGKGGLLLNNPGSRFAGEVQQ